MEQAEKINSDRLRIWKKYYDSLGSLADFGKIELPVIPEGCIHNGHMFYIKVKDIEERTALIQYLYDRNIKAVFHYIPLHTSPAGRLYGEFRGEDVHTTKESEKLLRLPLYYGLSERELEYIISSTKSFFQR
jgi:dTDP-4-amino-4,6-dideoxygalactose transaminase